MSASGRTLATVWLQWTYVVEKFFQCCPKLIDGVYLHQNPLWLIKRGFHICFSSYPIFILNNDYITLMWLIMETSESFLTDRSFMETLQCNKTPIIIHNHTVHCECTPEKTLCSCVKSTWPTKHKYRKTQQKWPPSCGLLCGSLLWMKCLHSIKSFINVYRFKQRERVLFP